MYLHVPSEHRDCVVDTQIPQIWCMSKPSQEFFFSDGGIASSGNLMSHKNPQMPDSKPEAFNGSKFCANQCLIGSYCCEAATGHWHGHVAIYWITNASCFGALLYFGHVPGNRNCSWSKLFQGLSADMLRVFASRYDLRAPKYFSCSWTCTSPVRWVLGRFSYLFHLRLRKNCNSFSDCALFYLLHKCAWSGFANTWRAMAGTWQAPGQEVQTDGEARCHPALLSHAQPLVFAGKSLIHLRFPDSLPLQLWTRLENDLWTAAL